MWKWERVHFTRYKGKVRKHVERIEMKLKTTKREQAMNKNVVSRE
jgi:hypothetical protein